MTRTIYVNDPELWKEARAYAENKGIALGVLVEQALRDKIVERDTCATCERIRYILSLK